MRSVTSPRGTIGPDEFNQYSSQWLTAASNQSTTELTLSFQHEGARMLLLRFPLDRMVALLSTVGVQYVKSRFLLVPGENDLQLFALALYATDARGERLSAYYLAEDCGTTPPTAPQLIGGIPTGLADIWLTNWQTAPQITAAMFHTSKGVLRGYDFKIEEFLAPLMLDQPFDNLELHLSFGLSEYDNATGDGVPTQTFSLLSRIYNSQQPSGGSGYYDMLSPHPPGA